MLAVVSSTKAEVMQSIWFAVILSVCLCVCRITAKVISRRLWHLVLWLGLQTGRTD